MNSGLAIAVMILVVATRPFETRAWRAGRLSDRGLAILILIRFPLLGLAAGVIGGAGLPAILMLFALMSIPSLALYRWTLRRIRERARDLDGPPPVHSR